MTLEERTSPVRLLVWFALVLLIAYIVFIGGGWLGIYSVDIRTFSLILIVAGLAIWFGVAVLRPDWRPQTVIWPAFLVSLVVFGLSLAASKTPRLGADYFAYAILLTALYLLLQRLMAHTFFRVRIALLCVALFLMVGLWYVVAVTQDWLGWWSLVGRITTPPLRPYFESLTWGNPSAVMTMAILLLAPAVAYIGFATPWRRLLVAVLAVLALVVTLMSGSRAGWLGLAIGTGITAIVWLATANGRRTVVRVLANPRARLAAGALLLLGAAASRIFGPAILLRVEGGGEDLRGTLFATAVRMFQESPVVGVGPGTWVVDRAANTLSDEVDYYIPHAHNLYFQTLAEFGLLGVAAGLLVIACLAWLIWDGIRDADPDRRRLGWVTLLATTYFGAHQLFDFYPNMPATLFAWAIPIAWLDATATRPLLRVALPGRLTPGWKRRIGALAGGAGVVLVAVATVWLVRSESAAQQMSNGVALANEGDWAGALPLFRAAATSDPDMPPYQLAYGIAAANSGDLPAAAEAFRRTAETDDLPSAWLNLAFVRARMGDDDGAREALERAVRLGGSQSEINMGAGVTWLALGDTARATESFALALQQVPSLAADPWWAANSDIAALWPSILATAMRQAMPEAAFEIALSMGDLAEAKVRADQITDPASSQLASLVIDAWGGDPAATASLYAHVAARPLDLQAAGWAARVAARSGDAMRAAQFRQWASAVSAGGGTFGHEIRVAPERSSVNLAGINSLFYGHYGYRRPTPWDQLVTGLPQLVYQ